MLSDKGQALSIRIKETLSQALLGAPLMTCPYSPYVLCSSIPHTELIYLLIYIYMSYKIMIGLTI